MGKMQTLMPAYSTVRCRAAARLSLPSQSSVSSGDLCLASEFDWDRPRCCDPTDNLCNMWGGSYQAGLKDALMGKMQASMSAHSTARCRAAARPSLSSELPEVSESDSDLNPDSGLNAAACGGRTGAHSAALQASSCRSHLSSTCTVLVVRLHASQCVQGGRSEHSQSDPESDPDSGLNAAACGGRTGAHSAALQASSCRSHLSSTCTVLVVRLHASQHL